MYSRARTDACPLSNGEVHVLCFDFDNRFGRCEYEYERDESAT